MTAGEGAGRPAAEAAVAPAAFAALVDEARAARAPVRLLFPEGDDARVRQAARSVTALGFAQVTLVTEQATAGVDTLHPRDLARLAEVEVDGPDGLATATARLVASGFAAGAVLGLRLSSGAVLRAGLRELGLAADRRRVAGCAWVHSERAGRPLLFVDPVVNVAPDAATLAEAAAGAAQLWHRVMRAGAKIAFLSSSTGGSGSDQYAELMAEAARLTAARAQGVVTAGPVQVDVALDPATAVAKGGGPIRGDASILVFPTLAAANIGLKLAEQLGGAEMCTFLTGLARPYNDLSRGSRADDIVGTAAITALQALSVPPAPITDDRDR